MLNLLLPVLLPSLATALPAPAPAAAAAAQPTLFTFTYLGNPVTATWYGTGANTAPAACPTQTFTYNGAAITVPYTGPGTPQSCLTSAAAPAGTQAPAVVPGNAGTQTVAVTKATDTQAATPVSTAKAATSSSASSASVQKGFNYGSTGANGAPLRQTDYLTSFNNAKNLVGASGFTSARLYTMIQAGTTNTPIEAIPAAISSGTTLLLGLWASAGQANIDNEIAALRSAISQYGTAFTNLVVGISVGSEDLYRTSVIGTQNNAGVGASPTELASYINQVKSAISGTILAGKLVGHVDTFNDFTNSTNVAVIQAADFLGMDAYPYFQYQQANSIEAAPGLFKLAYQETVAVAQGKPVWITETGWPTSGKTENLGVPSTTNAKAYWDAIGCDFAFNKINTWWYTLADSPATPSFGVTNGGTTPLYDLTCSA